MFNHVKRRWKRHENRYNRRYCEAYCVTAERGGKLCEWRIKDAWEAHALYGQLTTMKTQKGKLAYSNIVFHPNRGMIEHETFCAGRTYRK